LGSGFRKSLYTRPNCPATFETLQHRDLGGGVCGFGVQVSGRIPQTPPNCRKHLLRFKIGFGLWGLVLGFKGPEEAINTTKLCRKRFKTGFGVWALGLWGLVVRKDFVCSRRLLLLQPRGLQAKGGQPHWATGLQKAVLACVRADADTEPAPI